MPDKTTRIIFDLGSKIHISPPLFLNNKLENNPGDLSKFAPYGNGLYGYQGHNESNPLKGGPRNEASGGVIYFGNDITKDDLGSLMNILEVQPKSAYLKPKKDFALYVEESKDPKTEGYLTQMRVISKLGLCHGFRTLSESDYKNFPEQEVTIVEALWEFIEQEKKRWGTSFWDEKGLEGMFGGDGEYSREQLSFGFMVENSYHNIYRIWSRAWLVTK